MLPNLTKYLGKERATNHQIRFKTPNNMAPTLTFPFRCTAIKYMRRSGMTWADICKVTGHHLNLEGEGLANAAKAIGSGPEVAQGSTFQPVSLEKRKMAQEENVLWLRGV